MLWKSITINGITPKFVRSIDVDDFPERITLNCVAYTDEISSAKEEIDQFRSFAARTINQVDLLNDGMDLQIGSGEIVDVVLDDEEFMGAVHYPKPNSEILNKSGVVLRAGETPVNVEEVIEWEIVIELLFQNLPASTVYKPDYRVYPNIEYKLYNSQEVGGSRARLPSNVYEYSSGSYNTAWANPENVQAKDNNLASAYRNSSSVGGSRYLSCRAFGFNVPSDMVVNRMQIKIRYANNSKKRGKSFKYPRIYAVVKNSSYSKSYYKNYTQNTNPATMKEMIFDTANKTLTLPSSLPSFYNDANFRIDIMGTLDRYKTFWVDYVEVSLWYVPIGSATEPYDALGKEIGDMTIVEDRLVKQVEVTGNACNLPAWLEVNGVRQNWHFSHDHDQGDTGTDGIETLTFTLSPPADIIEMVSSPHKPYKISANNAEDNPGSQLQQVKVIYQ